jgi:hypothetical protein
MLGWAEKMSLKNAPDHRECLSLNFRGVESGPRLLANGFVVGLNTFHERDRHAHYLFRAPGHR